MVREPSYQGRVDDWAGVTSVTIELLDPAIAALTTNRRATSERMAAESCGLPFENSRMISALFSARVRLTLSFDKIPSPSQA